MWIDYTIQLRLANVLFCSSSIRNSSKRFGISFVIKILGKMRITYYSDWIVPIKLQWIYFLFVLGMLMTLPLAPPKWKHRHYHRYIRRVKVCFTTLLLFHVKKKSTKCSNAFLIRRLFTPYIIKDTHHNAILWQGSYQ